MTPSASSAPRRIGRSVLRLVACIGLMAAVSGVGGAVTAPQITGWYATLPKPGFTPPDAVFPIAWTALYTLMALSLWRLWDHAPQGRARTLALRLFLLQLALNFIWSPVFFAFHAVWLALLVVVALLVAVAATMGAAWRVDRLAGALLAPYLAWIAFASLLNAAIAVRLGSPLA